jgi:hypothetical protein
MRLWKALDLLLGEKDQIECSESSQAVCRLARVMKVTCRRVLESTLS